MPGYTAPPGIRERNFSSWVEKSYSPVNTLTSVSINQSTDLIGIWIDEKNLRAYVYNINTQSSPILINLDDGTFTELDATDENMSQFSEKNANIQYGGGGVNSIGGKYQVIPTVGFGTTQSVLRIYKNGVLVQTITVESGVNVGHGTQAISPSGKFIVVWSRSAVAPVFGRIHVYQGQA